MLDELLGASGRNAAERLRAWRGTKGAARAGRLRWAGVPALIAAAVGGYALKKYKDRKDAEAAKRKDFETPPAGAAG